MEGFKQSPGQENIEALPTWLPNDQYTMQAGSSMQRVELLLHQMAHQWQVERIEIRQDLMFICQYLNSLSERQDQHWQHMLYQHDQTLNEIRHSFQSVRSLFVNSPNSQAYTTNSFPMQENQNPKQGFPMPVIEGNEFSNQDIETICHQDNVREQNILNFDKNYVMNGSIVDVVDVEASLNGLSLQDEHIQRNSENQEHHQDVQDHYSTLQTLEPSSLVLRVRSESFDFNNKPQALNNVYLDNSRKEGEEYSKKQNYNGSVENGSEKSSTKSGLDFQQSEQKNKINSINDQEVQKTDEHKQQLPQRYVDTQRQTVNNYEGKIQSRYDNEQRGQWKHSNYYDKHLRSRYDPNIRSKYRDDQKVQPRTRNEQTVYSRNREELNIDSRHIDGQKEEQQKVNKGKQVDQKKQEDDGMVLKSNDSETKVQPRFINERDNKHEEQASKSQHLSLKENGLVSKSNEFKEQRRLPDEKPKKYAEAVRSTRAPDNLTFVSRESSEEHTTSDKSLPSIDTPEMHNSQESFEGTGFYADAISKLHNSMARMESVKPIDNSHVQTYQKNQDNKKYKSENIDSKIFNRSGNTNSYNDYNENKNRNKNKYR